MILTLLLSQLLLLCCPSLVAAEPKVLSLPFTKHARSMPLARRAPAAAILYNNITEYVVNVSLGSPPQYLQLQLDTGSSDIWMPNASFNSSQSSTFKSLPDFGNFFIKYLDESFANGTYFSDTINLGTGLQVRNQTMALVSSTDSQQGIMGIGYASIEAGFQYGTTPMFPTFVDSLVSANLIQSRSYSLWLDNSDASSGTILFGGYDSDQYRGEVSILPFVPYAPGGPIENFLVNLSSVAFTNGSGLSSVLDETQYPISVDLDSGTSLTVLPLSTVSQILDLLLVPYGYLGGLWEINCSAINSNFSIDFRFGGSGGAVIRVPSSELVIQRYYGPRAVCILGITNTSSPLEYILGDTFLRSAYVIYDLDSNQAGIAQSAWNSTTTSGRIHEIGPGGDLASYISGQSTTGTSSTSSTTKPTLSASIPVSTPKLSSAIASISGPRFNSSLTTTPTNIGTTPMIPTYMTPYSATTSNVGSECSTNSSKTQSTAKSIPASSSNTSSFTGPTPMVPSSTAPVPYTGGETKMIALFGPLIALPLAVAVL